MSKNAASLLPFNSEVPLSSRLAVLRVYFSPSFDSPVEFDPFEISQFEEKKTDAVGGYIQVTPPKGICFIITRRANEPDERVCASQPLKFDLSDLDSKGNFHWTVRTGVQDFGTVVHWQTPYRVARMMNLTMRWPGPIVPKIIKGCEATRTSQGTRKIYIRFIDGETWTTSFPEKDEMIPQPEKMPNLYVLESPETSFAALAESSSKSAPQNDKSEHAHEDDKTPKKAVTKKIEEKENITWQISQRSTFHMSSRYFAGPDSLPPLGGGECRYRYEDAESASGLMECHYVSNFKWVYIPLTCLSQVRQQ